MYDNLLKAQAETIAQLKAQVAERRPEAEDEIRRLRQELVNLTRDLQMMREFIRGLSLTDRQIRRAAEALVK